MQTRLIVKQGTETLVELTGRPMPSINMDYLDDVIKTEQFLERLLGYRFHIHVMYEA